MILDFFAYYYYKCIENVVEMQDIDFQRLYSYRGPKKESKIYSKGTLSKINYSKKFFVFMIIFIFAFTLGAFGGVYVSYTKEKPNELSVSDLEHDLESLNTLPVKEKPSKKQDEIFISKNISPSTHKDSSEKSKTTENISKIRDKFKPINQIKTYLIWAKTYTDKMMAYRHGHFLKKQKLPVFLAKSNDRMKLYVGPVYGKDQAYETLSKVKKWAPFKTAILHEKTN